MQADRLIAWDAELRSVHARLREALALARAAVDAARDGDGGTDAAAPRDAVVAGEGAIDVDASVRRDGVAAGEGAISIDASVRRDAVAAGEGAISIDASVRRDAVVAASRDLLLYCTGFCAALDRHHRSEDSGLFPALSAEHPELQPIIEKLMQDHSMLSYLLVQFRGALDTGADADALDRHLEGIAAIMESHFRYEERELLAPLAALRSTAARSELLGPLG